MATDAPIYLTPYQLAVQLDTDPVKFRDWLRHEPGRGRDHTAPPEHWISPGRRTYDAATVTEAWRSRPGHGGRPPKS